MPIALSKLGHNIMASHSGLSAGKRLNRAPAGDSLTKRGKFSDTFTTRINKEESILKEHINDPLFWGPYLAERQWGTVREDYSSDGSCWHHMTYKDATKQAYHWGEDGLLGVCDKFGLLCASLALWNKKDPILKERFFGLTGKEGNHGEDVKELYYYLDNTPKHNYMAALYHYPQAEFPYQKLVNHQNTPTDPELEIMDTGVFDENSYWDVKIEYAKPVSHTLICKMTVTNNSSKPAKLDVIPQFYFRNTWSKPSPEKVYTTPVFQMVGGDAIDAIYDMGIFRINFLHGNNVTVNSLLFTNNNSVHDEVEAQLCGADLRNLDAKREHCHEKYCRKDAFHRYIIHGEKKVVSTQQTGTKCCAWMTADLPANSATSVYWQIYPADAVGESTPQKLDHIITNQKTKARDFYAKVVPKEATPEEANVCRQAIAGLIWSKQMYILNMEMKMKELKILHGSKYFKTASGKKSLGWNHLTAHDILLMPDKWEFPWFAAWDLAFHCVQYARVDLPFAKEQLLLLLSDRYMHPNGQIPGCEFDFGDPNPPIMSWAVWKIFQFEGGRDLPFLKTCYNRLIFSFQWWTKMDPSSSYLYGNGFLGLDNISLFDRGNLPSGMTALKQADCTGWMGLFSLTMLQMSIELCNHDNSYTDMAIKFLKHFLHIARAINRPIHEGGLWEEEDKFFYDVIHYEDPHFTALRLRSWTGIIPLLACTSINLRNCPLVKTFLLKCDRGFSPFVCKLGDTEFFITLVSYTKLKMMLKTIFSEDEFLSPFGIRSLSKVYESKPYTFDVGGVPTSVKYLPGESDTHMFGGNSNWRGPIWLCMNYMFIECLEKYSDLDKVFTLPLSIQYPSGSAAKLTFLTIAHDLCKRIASIFLPNQSKCRPVHGNQTKYAKNPELEKLVLFYEYFHADTGRGCGASHQTGWSALVLEFIHKIHSRSS